MVIEMARSSCENSSIGGLLRQKVMRLGLITEYVASFIDHLNDSEYFFGMRSAPSKCEMLFHDSVGLMPNLVLARK